MNFGGTVGRPFVLDPAFSPLAKLSAATFPITGMGARGMKCLVPERRAQNKKPSIGAVLAAIIAGLPLGNFLSIVLPF